MKLATLKDGTRDGQLAVVSRDLKAAHLGDGIAPTLRQPSMTGPSSRPSLATCTSW